MADSVYSFKKLEDFFNDYQSWNRLGSVVGHDYNENKHTLSLTVEGGYPQGEPCCLLIQLLGLDTFRVRFSPGKMSPDEYPENNTRAVVMDTFEELCKEWAEFTTKCSKTTDPGSAVTSIDLLTRTKETNAVYMKISVGCKPFSIRVLRFYGGNVGQPYQIWSTNEEVGLCWVLGDQPGEGGDTIPNFEIIQAVNKPATAKYTGFGEQGGISLFKNSQQLTFFNYDNYRYCQVYGHGPLDQREPLYHSDPFFIEFNGIPGSTSVNGMYIDNYSQICFDLGYLHSNRYMFGTRFGDLDYYVFAGDNCRDIIDSFTSLVGRCRLKPRFILGYHQGCYGWTNRQDVENALKGYRDHRIPIDGLHIDVDAQMNYQTFTLDPTTFPNPQEMFSNLRLNGAKCSTNITPIIAKDLTGNYSTYMEAIKNGYFIPDQRAPSRSGVNLQQYYEGGQLVIKDIVIPTGTGSYTGRVNYGEGRGVIGHYPDLGRLEVRKWWGEQYKQLFDWGLEFVWQDMTTPAIDKSCGDMKGFPFRLLVTDDSLSSIQPSKSPAIKVWNLYSYNLHKATFHGIDHLPGRENKRTFIIGRGSYTGSHRFCGLWTGDNASTWDFFRINVAQVLAVGLSGLSIVGADIGGFDQGDDQGQWASPELLIRWTIAGSFLPWFRNHYIRHNKKLFQEPYMYKDYENWRGVTSQQRLLYRAVLPVTKHYIELRYRLLQLWYDAMWENVLTGLPLCRALFINDPQDLALFNDKLEFNSSEFFVAKDLLVAPIMDPGVDTRDVYLPYGHNWYCFMDGRMPLASPIEGGTTIRNFDARIDAENNLHLGFHVPVYIRAGAIIPEIPLEQWVGELNEKGKPCNITFNIYPGQSGHYTMYLDDGISRSSAPKNAPQYKFMVEEDKRNIPNDEYRKVEIEHEKSGASRIISIRRSKDEYTPRFEKFYRVALLHDPSEPRSSSNDPLKSIVVNGVTLGGPDKDTVQSNDNNEPVNAWYYEKSNNISYIKVIDVKDISIKVEYNSA